MIQVSLVRCNSSMRLQISIKEQVPRCGMAMQQVLNLYNSGFDSHLGSQRVLNALVAQLAEAHVLGTCQCQFKSDRVYQNNADVMESVYISDLKSEFYGFESRHPYQSFISKLFVPLNQYMWSNYKNLPRVSLSAEIQTVSI